MFDNRRAAEEKRQQISEAEQKVSDARARVAEMEQRLRATKNPFLARPKPPEENAEQGSGWWCAVDRSLEALAAQPRQVARVIDMRVGEDHGVDVVRRMGQLLPVELAVLGWALEEAAVDHHAEALPLK